MPGSAISKLAGRFRRQLPEGGQVMRAWTSGVQAAAVLRAVGQTCRVDRSCVPIRLRYRQQK